MGVDRKTFMPQAFTCKTYRHTNTPNDLWSPWNNVIHNMSGQQHTKSSCCRHLLATITPIQAHQMTHGVLNAAGIVHSVGVSTEIHIG